MGYVPPLLPANLTLSEKQMLDSRLAKLYRGTGGGKIIFLPSSISAEPLITQPINCRGCGANHAAEQCPYCGRGRS
jgi:hypothetical protein